MVQEATGMNFTLWWTIEWHVQQVIRETFKSPSSLEVFICCVEDPFRTHNLIDKHITNWSWLKLHHLFTVFAFTLSKSNKSPQIENTRDSPQTFRENRKLKSWVQLHKSLLQKQSYLLDYYTSCSIYPVHFVCSHPMMMRMMTMMMVKMMTTKWLCWRGE